jgi:hypothetical protein
VPAVICRHPLLFLKAWPNADQLRANQLANQVEALRARAQRAHRPDLLLLRDLREQIRASSSTAAVPSRVFTCSWRMPSVLAHAR